MVQLDRVREVMHQQPFRPFTVHLLNGSSYLVKHPDFLALPPGTRKRDIVLYGDDGVHLIDLALIQEIVLAGEGSPSMSPPEGDGAES
jgi:hypothetical protein